MTTTKNAIERGVELLAQKQPAGALDAFRVALAGGGDPVPAIVGAGAALLDLGDNEKAWHLLQAATDCLPPVVGAHPAAAMAFAYLGIACARLDRSEEARAAFGQSLQEDNGNFIYSDAEAHQAMDSVWLLQ